MVIALRYIKNALADLLHIKVKINLHSVGDWDENCQWHLSFFWSRHMFGNADDEFPAEVVKEVAEKQQKCFDLVANAKMNTEVAIEKFKVWYEGFAENVDLGKCAAPRKGCDKICSVVPGLRVRVGVLWL